MAAGSEKFRCHQSVLHATTVEVEVIVMLMVLVMVMVVVTVVVAVTVAVTAEVFSSVLPQPCKDSEAMKPKQMAMNARANCMITTGSDAGTKNKCRSGLFTL